MSLSDEQYRRFSNWTFDSFRKAAQDESLSKYEKIGYPDSYRDDKEGLVFQNILANLPLLNERGKVVLDVGPGCSGLPLMMVDLCRKQGHKLLLVDSEEMLAHLPNDDFIQKFPAYYPQCEPLFEQYTSKVDVLLTYGVVQLVFVEGNLWDFLDRSLELLAEGGQMLIGERSGLGSNRAPPEGSGRDYRKACRC